MGVLFFFYMEHFNYFIALEAASGENLISGYGCPVGHALSCFLKETEEIVRYRYTTHTHAHRLMIQLHIDVNHHRPLGDGVLNANVVCNNAARMLCLRRFCLPHAPAQSLTLDW